MGERGLSSSESLGSGSESELRALSPAALAMSGRLGSRKLKRTVSPWLGRVRLLRFLLREEEVVGLTV